jgi:hypothetical protein
MVSDPKLFDHVAACELAEKRAIAVYGAVFAQLALRDGQSHVGMHADIDVRSWHETAATAARTVPRPEPYRVPTALERQQAAVQLNATPAVSTFWEQRK